MKTISYLFLLVLFGSTTLHAQKQITFGVSVPFILNTNLSYQSSWGAEVGFRIPVHSRVYLQPSVSVSNNFRHHDIFYQYKKRLNFYNLGLLGGYVLLKGSPRFNIHLQAGISARYNDFEVSHELFEYSLHSITPAVEAGASFLYKTNSKWSLAVNLNASTIAFSGKAVSGWCPVGQSAEKRLYTEYSNIYFSPSISIIRSL